MTHNAFKILLSASVPSERGDEKYIKIKNAQIQIEEAVIGLARNIFQANGSIVFGGHPSISPLVLMVATEFKINREAEDMSRNENYLKPISIFQSKAYEGFIPNETTGLYSLGYSNIVWTDAAPGEKYNPDVKEKGQCRESLRLMRKEMIGGDIDALVCIGGMDGVEAEFKLFRELHPQKPVYLLQTTGGASKILAQEFANNPFVKVIDNKEIYIQKKSEDTPEEFNIIPFTFITALIVKDLIQDMQSRH